MLGRQVRRRVSGVRRQALGGRVLTPADRHLRVVSAILFLALFAAILPLNAGRASADGAGTVYLHIHPCPERTDAGLPNDYQTLYSMCQETTPYYSFNLITEGNFLGGQQISGDALGLYWDNVPMHIFS